VSEAPSVTRQYTRACALREVVEGAARRYVIDDTPVAIVRSEGEMYAIYDVCSHENIPLSEGEVYDGGIECWLHGSCFDLRTGEPTSLPATESVPVYPVKIEGDDVFVAVTEEQPT